MPTVGIEAPEDAFLDELAAAGPVIARQKVAIFRSPVLDRLAASLSAMQDHVGVLERPLKDGRIDEEIRMYGDKVTVLKDAINECQIMLEEAKDRVTLGAATPAYVAKVASSLATAKAIS